MDRVHMWSMDSVQKGIHVLSSPVFKVLVFEVLIFEVLVFEVLIFKVLIFEVFESYWGLRS